MYNTLKWELFRNRIVDFSCHMLYFCPYNNFLWFHTRFIGTKADELCMLVTWVTIDLFAIMTKESHNFNLGFYVATFFIVLLNLI